MKKFAYLLTLIIPHIVHANCHDDGHISVTYKRGSQTKSTIMPLKDYENAVDRNRKMYGLLDKIHGLS
jgi:hypothetical protein